MPPIEMYKRKYNRNTAGGRTQFAFRAEIRKKLVFGNGRIDLI